MVLVIAELGIGWRWKWFSRPRQGTRMTVEDYHTQFCDWKEEMITLSFPAEEADYIDGFIENLSCDIGLRVSKWRLSISSLSDAFHNAKWEESLINIEGNLMEIRATRVFDEIPSPTPLECEKVIIAESVEALKPEGGAYKLECASSIFPSLEAGIQMTDGVGQPSTLKTEYPEVAHNLFDEMPSPPAIELNEENVSLDEMLMRVPVKNGEDVLGVYGFAGESYQPHLRSIELYMDTLNPWGESEIDKNGVDEVEKFFSSKIGRLEIGHHMFDEIPALFSALRYEGTVVCGEIIPLVVGLPRDLSYGSEVIKLNSFNISSMSKFEEEFLFVDIKNYEFDVDCWHNGLLMFIFDPGGRFSPKMGCDFIDSNGVKQDLDKMPSNSFVELWVGKVFLFIFDPGGVSSLKIYAYVKKGNLLDSGDVHLVGPILFAPDTGMQHCCIIEDLIIAACKDYTWRHNLPLLVNNASFLFHCIANHVWKCWLLSSQAHHFIDDTSEDLGTMFCVFENFHGPIPHRRAWIMKMVNCSTGMALLLAKTANRTYFWKPSTTDHVLNIVDVVGVFIGDMADRYGKDKEEGDVLENIIGVDSPSVALLKIYLVLIFCVHSNFHLTMKTYSDGQIQTIDSSNKFLDWPDDLGYRLGLQFSREHGKLSSGIVKDKTKYLMVVVSGGLNQQWNENVDDVVIPVLQVNVTICSDEAEFTNIFDVKIVSLLPCKCLRVLDHFHEARILRGQNVVLIMAITFENFVWHPGLCAIFLLILEDKDVLKRKGIWVGLVLRQDDWLNGATARYDAHMELLACSLVDWEWLLIFITSPESRTSKSYSLMRLFITFGSFFELTSEDGHRLQMKQHGEGSVDVCLFLEMKQHQGFIMIINLQRTPAVGPAWLHTLSWKQGRWSNSSVIQFAMKFDDYFFNTKVENFVWDPGLVWGAYLTTLRTRCSIRGGICHDIAFYYNFYMYFRIFVFTYLAGYDVIY